MIRLGGGVDANAQTLCCLTNAEPDPPVVIAVWTMPLEFEPRIQSLRCYAERLPRRLLHGVTEHLRPMLRFVLFGWLAHYAASLSGPSV